MSAANRVLRLVLPALVGAALAAACTTVGPNYRRPQLSVPAKFSATALVPAARSASSPGALAAWWKQFHDAQLSALIAQAMRGNLGLKAAASRVRQARDQLVIAGAARTPVINADASASALHLSKNSGLSEFASLFSGGRGGGAASGFGLPGNNITTYTLGADASWQIDPFGGVRRSIQAAEATAEQAVWSRRDSEVSIAAEVANDYWQLRSLQGEIATANDQVREQRELLSLLKARRRFGFVTDQDVRSQAAQLELARAVLPDLDSARQALIHALGVLVGEPPEAMEARLSSVGAAPPPQATAIPVGLPSGLLRRRPDVRAAERALAASSARIGVAVDKLFPRINLTGAVDLVSLALKQLMDVSSGQYTGAAALDWALFDRGAGRANVRIARELNRQALYAYQSTVLNALREVEDGLTRYGDELKRNQALQQAVTDAQGAAEVARRQYQKGLNNIQPVLLAESTALQARMQLIQSDGALARDLASLYKALGGGWTGN